MFKLPASIGSIVLLFSACASTQPTAPGPQDAMQRFRTAFNGQDAAGVANSIVADGKLLPPGKPIVSGTDNIRAHWQATFNAGVSHIEKTPIDISVQGDLAVETSSYVVTFKDQPIVGKDTLVWRRGADKVWRIYSDIWNSDK